MQQIKGISQDIVDDLVARANKLGQGRTAGMIGFVDEDQIISGRSEIINGGVSGLPYRKLLSGINEESSLSLLEMLNSLPDDIVIISVKPGKTGIILGTGGINVFNLPVVKVGVKNCQEAGVGLLYPRKKYFQLATKSEQIKLKSLAALTMEEEKQALRESSKLHLKYLDISEPIPIVSQTGQVYSLAEKQTEKWQLPEIPSIKAIDVDFAQRLVDKSLQIEQGREVAAMGQVSAQGKIEQVGEIVVGGMGYIPSRLLASSYQDISDISLRQAYTEIIPADCMIVHTHPGGTGVMHINDAMAGPGTWGRPIGAIGHSETGEIKGVNVISPSQKLFQLADEKEELEQKFFEVDSSNEEVKLRKRKHGIAQEFTDLCREIKVK